MVRKRNIYIDKYGPVAGGKLYHALQSQAAHAGVSARLRRKICAMSQRQTRPLPLFPEGPVEAIREPVLTGALSVGEADVSRN